MIDRHGDYLFRYAAFRINNQAMAQDLVQDTFLAALKSAPGYQGKSAIKTWLTSILKNKIIDYYRKTARRYEVVQSDVGEEDNNDFDASGRWRADRNPADWGEHPEQALNQKEFMRILYACLKLLTEKAAGVFMLREMEGLASAEICDRLGISSSNLWVLLYRARNRLRDCLNKNWFEKN